MPKILTLTLGRNDARIERELDPSTRFLSVDQGVSDVVAKIGNTAIPAEYDADTRSIKLRAGVAKDGNTKVELTFTGKRTDTRFVDADAAPAPAAPPA